MKYMLLADSPRVGVDRRAGSPFVVAHDPSECARPVGQHGPFAEAKEGLVSFSIIDVVDHERAMEIAARVVAGVGDAIELRPIMDGPSDEGLPRR
ncbi:MAG TPA: hypothetical protein VIY28_07455 [Pseudonocardiaceae bacterium]